MKRLLILVPMLSVLTGCELLDILEESGVEVDDFLPTVTFSRMDVQAVDWDGVDADFVFNVNNPNPLEVKLARFSYALNFEGVEWLSGEDLDGLVLPAVGSSEVSLPVSLEYLELYDLVQAVRGLDNIAFGLEGQFGFDTDALGPIDIPYAADGDFPAPRRPAFDLSNFRLEDLSLTGAEFAVDVNIDNDHGSNLNFLDTNFSIESGGLKLGGGTIATLGTVEGASTSTVAFPIAIDFLDVGLAAYDLLTEKEITLKLGGDTDVDTPFGILPLDFEESKTLTIQK